MKENKKLQMISFLLAQARKLGADLAGFASVEELKKAPSFNISCSIPESFVDASNAVDENGPVQVASEEVRWPEGAKTVMIVAVHHPDNRPEMDWWYGWTDPPGNKILAKIVQSLCEYASDLYGVEVFHLPYHVEKGGIYLKDAAVIAGLGCIGRNNLLITPEFGPRVRLRAFTLNVELPSTGPSEFNPCRNCEGQCVKACPQNAFSDNVSDRGLRGEGILYYGEKIFSRAACYRQMETDEAEAVRYRPALELTNLYMNYLMVVNGQQKGHYLF
ncbi:MAG: epoxyqueuosine reductase [Deltaproteobacteria bacterium]|nr:epoxyqueuosine reductase [Deltaproteobacteria bacterium]